MARDAEAVNACPWPAVKARFITGDVPLTAAVEQRCKNIRSKSAGTWRILSVLG